MFKLQEIKNYKKIIKEKEEIKLSSLLKDKEKLKQRVFSLENEYSSIQGKIRELFHDNFNISLVNLYNDSLDGIKEEIKKKEFEIKKIDELIERQKEIIKKATIDYKKFEKLEEIQKKKEEEKRKNQEKKELDEIVMNMSNRKDT